MVMERCRIVRPSDLLQIADHGGGGLGQLANKEAANDANEQKALVSLQEVRHNPERVGGAHHQGVRRRDARGRDFDLIPAKAIRSRKGGCGARWRQGQNALEVGCSLRLKWPPLPGTRDES